MGYELKQVPEDFKVEEMPAVKKEREGNYSYYWMQKRNYNTLKAIKMVSANLGIGIRRFGWAGNKDKNAITRQLISIENANGERIRRLKLEGISLELYGRGKERIYTGNLLGNKFAITVRNLSRSDCDNIARNCGAIRRNGFLFPNYFDEQRFGRSNIEVAEALLKRNFKLAAEKIYRAEVAKPVEALRKVHGSVLSMFIHSYQSLLFNEMLSEYIISCCSGAAEEKYSRGSFYFPSEKIPDAKIPVVGFGTELGNDMISRITAAVMERHGIAQRDFIIRQLPEVTAEGAVRNALAQAKGLAIGKAEEDELNTGKKKCAISFSLDKGCYATIAVRALLSPAVHRREEHP